MILRAARGRLSFSQIQILNQHPLKRLLFIAITISFASCNVHERKNEEGEKLSKLYCGSCHQAPRPSQLDKKTWLLSVFPKMGPRLGIYSYQGFPYEVNRNSPGLPKNYYPDSSSISDDDWAKIVNYFYEEAPDSLNEKYSPIDTTLDRFEIKTPLFPNETPPVTCLVKIDQKKRGIYIVHGTQLLLKSFDQNLKKIDEAKLKTVAVGLNLPDNNQSGLLLNMGALTPYDVTHGSLQKITVDKNLKIHLGDTLLEAGLPRPVHISVGDVDGDNNEDVVVCGFGNFTGELFWLRNAGNNTYEKKSLRNLPGAIQTLLTDINNDNRIDILALMAQGDEGVFAYEQQRDGSFIEKKILQFSPVAGSIAIDLADFNKDGYPDLVYTSGDNADYSKILKPYHGVYIFINDGHWNFKQEFFFPINGCFKAIAKDFDLDGDYDIITIAYFADFKKRPEESIVYLENEGKMEFKPFTIPQHSLGRWLTLDAGDLDNDGDDDIVIGNMSIGPSNLTPNSDWRKGPEFLLLLNKTK